MDVQAEQLLTFSDAERFLIEQLPSSEKKVFAGAEGMRRGLHLLERLGNPQEDYRSVHIAGTSGKGSVAHFLSELLIAHDHRVGTHVSPHMYDIRERFMIDQQLVAEAEFVEATRRLVPETQAMNRTEFGRPTYLETTNAMAFHTFARHQVDYAVIETGMGGLYDATNCIARPDKLALITKLGLDHVKRLGRTYREIAAQKAGILPNQGEGIYLVPRLQTAHQAITETAAARGTELRAVTPAMFQHVDVSTGGTRFDYRGSRQALPGLHLAAIGRHQAENASLALEALGHLAARDGWEVSETACREALARAVIPGRFEARRHHDQLVIFDGAHNRQKMQALLKTLDELDPVEPPVFLIAFRRTKQYAETIKPLVERAGQVVVTQCFNDRPYLGGLLAEPAERIAETVHRLGLPAAETVTDPVAALDRACALAKPRQLVVATGSFYLLSELNQAWADA